MSDFIADKDQTAKLVAVIELARTCESEYEHVTHVSNLTLRLYDDLASLHKMDPDDRFLLQCASILHDIGWVDGWKNHHKAALQIILETPMLPFNHRDRLIIGSIARYHRKALPILAHDHFAAMNIDDRHKVKVLAGFLRLADGLDRTHRGKIRDVHCKIKKQRIEIICASAFPATEEQKGGVEKADLLSLVFDREISIKIKPLL